MLSGHFSREYVAVSPLLYREQVTVHSFVIYNRRACSECDSYPEQAGCANRLACGSACGDACGGACGDAGATCGAEFRVGDSACATDMGGDTYDECRRNLVCHVFSTDAEQIAGECAPTPLNGRYAQVILVGSDRVLSLREVRVYGTQSATAELSRADASYRSMGGLPGDNCIDGVDDSDANVCQGRRETDPWLQIDFGETVLANPRIALMAWTTTMRTHATGVARRTRGCRSTSARR